MHLILIWFGCCWLVIIIGFIWSFWAGDVSCEVPDGPNGRSTSRRPCSGMVWRRCVCDNGALARPIAQNATDIPANDNDTVSHLFQ